MEFNLIKIEIITHQEATSREITDLRKIAKDSGFEEISVENKIVRKMGVDLPPEILIFIWLGAPIVTGFLQEIGAEGWRSLKRFIRRVFKHYENKQEPIYNPIITTEIRVESRPNIQLIFPTKNFKELKKALDEIDVHLRNRKPNQFLVLYFYKGKWGTKKNILKN